MRCILVYGLESSGTSCVAGILHHLGVYMGERFPPPSKTNYRGYFEDINFVNGMKIFCSRDYWEQAIFDWIETRIDREIWGLKNPLLRLVSDKVLRVFESDFFDIEIKMVYVTRDIANIVKSQARKRPKSTFKEVQCNVISSQVRLAELMEKLRLKYSVLDVGYDFVIDHTGDAVEKLAEFCFSDGYEGFACDDGFVRAVEFVEPGMRRFGKD